MLRQRDPRERETTSRGGGVTLNRTAAVFLGVLAALVAWKYGIEPEVYRWRVSAAANDLVRRERNHEPSPRLGTSWDALWGDRFSRDVLEEYERLQPTPHGQAAIDAAFAPLQRKLEELQPLERNRRWEHLSNVLPYDERAPELTPKADSGDQIAFDDSRGFTIWIEHQDGAYGVDLRQRLFLSDEPVRFVDNDGMHFDQYRSGTVDVQGRKLRVLRVRVALTALAQKAGQQLEFDNLTYVDVTPESQAGLVLVRMARMSGSECASEDEIRALLKPFRIGPTR